MNQRPPVFNMLLNIIRQDQTVIRGIVDRQEIFTFYLQIFLFGFPEDEKTFHVLNYCVLLAKFYIYIDKRFSKETG